MPTCMLWHAQKCISDSTSTVIQIQYNALPHRKRARFYQKLEEARTIDRIEPKRHFIAPSLAGDYSSITHSLKTVIALTYMVKSFCRLSESMPKMLALYYTMLFIFATFIFHTATMLSNRGWNRLEICRLCNDNVCSSVGWGMEQ